ncbi:hypothetical protein F2Q70_00015921 [Brassica cretica]|uniref:Uncharacterized protein n=1 Tax=Brassica cretica TaxID=69181 RepID=A0A8S9HUG3_BRACR|nr:hypothetical protein F2Q70_00015921 [Brassica cretica]KAF2599709.1 hypothetical protein F2Q68_00008831 [Brassica cretica]
MEAAWISEEVPDKVLRLAISSRNKSTRWGSSYLRNREWRQEKPEKAAQGPSTKQTMPPTNNLTSTTSFSLSRDTRDIPICLFGHQIWPRSLSGDTEMHPDVDLDAGSGRNPARTREKKQSGSEKHVALTRGREIK